LALAGRTMFTGSIRELLMWIGGMLVAAVVTVLGLFYWIDNVAMHDTDDPFERQGGLSPDQETQLSPRASAEPAGAIRR